MGRSAAEQEVTFRWDQEEQVLWAGTTTPRVAIRWRKASYAVVCIGRDRDGTECSWEVKLPWTGSKRPWTRLFSLAVSRWCSADDAADGKPPEDEKWDADDA
jgi:hypothetical protein